MVGVGSNFDLDLGLAFVCFSFLGVCVYGYAILVVLDGGGGGRLWRWWLLWLVL